MFEELTTRVSFGRKGMPASVGLSGGKKDGRPRMCVGLTAQVVKQLKIKSGEKFSIAIGKEDQDGLLRIRRAANGAGVFAPRLTKGGGALFDLGYVERFGSEPMAKEYVNASVTDRDTIVVNLPATLTAGDEEAGEE